MGSGAAESFTSSSGRSQKAWGLRAMEGRLRRDARCWRSVRRHPSLGRYAARLSCRRWAGGWEGHGDPGRDAGSAGHRLPSGREDSSYGADGHLCKMTTVTKRCGGQGHGAWSV